MSSTLGTMFVVVSVGRIRERKMSANQEAFQNVTSQQRADALFSIGNMHLDGPQNVAGRGFQLLLRRTVKRKRKHAPSGYLALKYACGSAVCYKESQRYR